MARSTDTVGTIGTVGELGPLAGILARFAPSFANPAAVHPAPCEPTDEVLDLGERQRLMTETVERLSRQYRGHAIDWSEADTINAMIGQTFSRPAMMKLLQQYEAAVTGQPYSVSNRVNAADFPRPGTIVPKRV